jgi:hypothetical protein
LRVDPAGVGRKLWPAIGFGGHQDRAVARAQELDELLAVDFFVSGDIPRHDYDGSVRK